MFSIGDTVCYPMHGVGVIESVEERSILGESKRYYVMRFILGRMTAMIPVDSADSVGLRPLVSPEECERVAAYLKTPEVAEESTNWNQRYRDNMEKLKQGNLMLEAEVVKCLLSRDKKKGLSTGERKMLITARQVLVTELAVSTGKEESIYFELVSG